MTRSRYRRAKRYYRLRKVRYAVTGFYRSVTWPILNPRMWLFCRCAAVVWGVYYHVDEAKGIALARHWPYVHHSVVWVLNQKGDYRWGLAA